MREQTRAAYPDVDGFVERDGIRVHYEVYGDGDPTVLLLPSWAIVHSRMWKGQIPFLARHGRVLALDPRGNGGSDRPIDRAAYSEGEYAADALAVLDATGTDAAYVVGHSMGAQRGLILAAEHPERVRALVLICPAVPLGGHLPRSQSMVHFDMPVEAPTDWEKFNARHWRADYSDFLEFFFDQVYSEPHSTKQHEDAVAWGHEVPVDALIATAVAEDVDEPTLRKLAERLTCPVLVIHGDDEKVRSRRSGAALAELTGAEFLMLHGSGHAPHARIPVQVNQHLRDFLWPSPPPRPRRTRDKRLLYVSSPIGLGHAQRDIAIVDQLRELRPGLQVDWLAQHPVTTALAQRGERIHPASRFLASESSHIESESAEHDLHAFQAIRRMDEILVANFMVFDDLVREEQYDAWVGDEAWELDYFLHEHPHLKRAPYAWLTDFVGWLPMADGGAREAAITADYNAEMVEHIARHSGVRDRALFVGNPDDVVPDAFGPDLPLIRDWTEQHFDFPGYVTGFDPRSLADREALRAELGYADDELVCLVTVGGSGVGEALLRRAVDAFALAREELPNLRMIVVAGPRIDPASLPHPTAVEVRAYVPGLYRHLAACDIAVVQGGLTTCMELTANRRPFLYFPLRHHFEQTFHVPHRLGRYASGRRMDYATDGPEQIAAALVEELGRPIAYRPVEGDGAARAAALLADLL